MFLQNDDMMNFIDCLDRSILSKMYCRLGRHSQSTSVGRMQALVEYPNRKFSATGMSEINYLVNLENFDPCLKFYLLFHVPIQCLIVRTTKINLS